MGKTASLANIGTIADSSLGFRNRIINGAMVIDQRNAGASVTPTDGAYTVDRFVYNATQASKFTAQQTPSATETGYETRIAAGFTNYLAMTVSSAVSIGAGDFFTIGQRIEGFNTADLAWGTASAKSVTLSFWVRSSLTGTFGGAICNSAINRNYPFTYTISTANTWEQKSVTIAGDTSGTWLTTNGIGLRLYMGLGVGSTYAGTAGAWTGTTSIIGATGAVSVVGTNGATFYITGVQLEKGSTATSFDYRPIGTELALCQRYYTKISNPSTSSASYGSMVGAYLTTRVIATPIFLPVPLRTSAYSVTYSSVVLYTIGLASSYPVTALSGWAGEINAPSLDIYVASGLTVGQSYIFTIMAGGNVAYSAEL